MAFPHFRLRALAAACAVWLRAFPAPAPDAPRPLPALPAFPAPLPTDAEARGMLLARGIVFLDGPVDAAMLARFSAELRMLEAAGFADIEIRIASGGGHCDEGLAIYDLLRAFKRRRRDARITGIVIFKAHSMASVILQACDERVMSRHATMLIHNLSSCGEIAYDQLADPAQFRAWKADKTRTNDRLVAAYMRRAKVSRAAVKAQMKRNEEMTAEEALRMGLADRIAD